MKLREKLTGQDRNKEEGAALIFAILLLMMLMLVITIVATTAVTSANTAGSLSSRTVYRNAAEVAISNALQVANQGAANALESRRNVGNATYGNQTADSSSRGSDICWRWYSEQVVFPGRQVGYYIYATGGNKINSASACNSSNVDWNKGVSLRAQLRPTAVDASAGKTTGGTAADPTIGYTMLPSEPWQWGITGKTAVTVEENTKIYSADSNYGGVPSGTAATGTSVATNGQVTMGKDSGLLERSYAAPTSTGTGCSDFTTGSGACDQSGATYRGFRLVTENNVGSSTRCPSTGTYPSWVASQHGGVMDLTDGACVQSLVFDVNTTLPANWSSNIPLTIYNTGNTTIHKGVSVNQNNIPQAMEIFSGTGNLDVGLGGTGTATTRASFWFASDEGTCRTHTGTVFFGAVSCANVNLLSGTTFYLDLASRNAGVNSGNRSIWSQSYVEEL